MQVSAFYVNKHLKNTVDIDIKFNEKQLLKIAAILATISLTGMAPNPVLAASGGIDALQPEGLDLGIETVGLEGTDISDKISKATQPIKDLLIGVADPVCYLVFVWGLLECMLGKGSSGITRMKYASLGYMGMNWLPVLMNIIRQAKP